jgi:hypothetical protein
MYNSLQIRKDPYTTISLPRKRPGCTYTWIFEHESPPFWELLFEVELRMEPEPKT